MKSTLAALVAVLSVASPAAAHVTLHAALDVAQETPAPSGVGAGAGGSATFTFDDETKMLGYSASVRGLTGDPLAGHLHQGPAGTAGPIKVTLPALPKNDGAAVSGSVKIDDAATVEALFGGGLYVNFHTRANGAGEVRGQVFPDDGKCSCQRAKSSAAFRKCVRLEVAKLPAEERKEEVFKQLRARADETSCGRTKPNRRSPKGTACCLVLPPEENIAVGTVCTPLREKRCTKLGGTSGGTSCFPTNPCAFPAP